MKPFNKSAVLEKVSNIIPVLIAFLLPIFFLPTSTEFFSFNKLALLTVALLLLIVLWGIKTIAGHKLEVIKSIIDRPLLILLGVLILSTIFSINKTDSIWGTQGRWLGLFAFVVIAGYYYLSTAAFKNSKIMKKSLIALVASSTISSIASILSYYKIYLGSAAFLKIQNFSLTGSIKDAIILAVLAVILSLVLTIFSRSMLGKIALTAVIAINFFFIAITGTLLGWVMLVVGILAIVFFTNKRKLLDEKMALAGPLILMVLILGMTLLPQSRDALVDKTYVTESMLPTKESWIIATSTIQDYPILATGPSTFDLNYTRFKPLSINATDLWDRRFDKPYNELFNILGTIGIVGMAAAIYFAFQTVKFSLVTREVKDENGISVIASVLTVVIMVSFLFTYASILSTFLLFFALSLLVGVNSLNGISKYTKSLVIEATTLSSIASDDRSVVTGQYTKYVLSIPAFVIAGFLGYLAFRNYAAEYFMRKSLVALSAGDSAATYRYENLAIKYNPNRDVYYDSLARTELSLANALASKTTLTDLDKQTIQTLVTQAIANTRITTESVSPLNVNNWETRALIYKSIVNLAQNATDWAISSYTTAITLDPTNPRLRVDLGGIYFAKGDFLSAANQFRQATALKSDYANAHYNFALALANLKEYDQAKKELDITKLLVPAGSPDSAAVDAAISALPVTTATSTKPTVEELSGVGSKATQEPLTNTGTTKSPLSPTVLPK